MMNASMMKKVNLIIINVNTIKMIIVIGMCAFIIMNIVRNKPPSPSYDACINDEIGDRDHTLCIAILFPREIDKSSSKS